MGNVVQILKLRKGRPARVLWAAFLQRRVGLRSDRYAKGGKQQISLQFELETDRTRRRAADGDSGGLCSGRFRANLRLCGMRRPPQVGMWLQAGTSCIEITALKACYPDCPRSEEGRFCALKNRCAFGIVRQSGTVCVGDAALQMLKKRRPAAESAARLRLR